MGLLRVFLALCVVQYHAGLSILFLGHEALSGRVAVQLFFVISGFYMALILNEKYPAKTDNALFYSNRYLRLWPAYGISLLLVGILAAWTGKISTFEQTLQINEFWTNLLSTPLEWQVFFIFSNLTMIGMDFQWFLAPSDSGILFTPYEGGTNHPGGAYGLNIPIFTVAIELSFYLIAPFILRSLFKTVLFLIGALIYHLILAYFAETSFFWTYHFFPSAYLYFAAGAIVYQVYRHQKQNYRAAIDLIFITISLALLTIGLQYELSDIGQGYVFGLALALAIPALFNVSKTNRVDRWLGELSYPIYVLHYPIFQYIGPLFERPWSGSMVMALSVVAAVIVKIIIEDPIDSWRQKRITSHR